MQEIRWITQVEPLCANVDAVIFDLDDTLYLERDYVRSGYAAVAREFPDIPCMEDTLWSAFLHGGRAIDDALAAHGMATEENLARALHVYRYHTPSIQLLDGAEALLTRLRASGKRLGIITDGRPEGQWAKLKALGLPMLVDEIIVTDELGGVEFRKPNETAFRLMQQRMDLPFARMMYVGDNLKKDFVAPMALGMQTCYHRVSGGLYTENPS